MYFKACIYVVYRFGALYTYFLKYIILMYAFFRCTALCTGVLREMGVTAVLNAAQGSMTDWNYVNTKEIYYSGLGIQFLGTNIYKDSQDCFTKLQFLHGFGIRRHQILGDPRMKM